MGKELSSLLRLYKSHKCSRNKQKSPYSKKGETTYSSQIWSIKEGGSMSSPGGTNHHVCWTQVLFMKEVDFPSSPCHATKKDSWCGRVPQTLWQGRPLHLLSQQYYLAILQSGTKEYDSFTGIKGLGFLGLKIGYFNKMKE